MIYESIEPTIELIRTRTHAFTATEDRVLLIFSIYTPPGMIFLSLLQQ